MSEESNNEPVWPLFDLRLALNDTALRPVRETDLSELARILPDEFVGFCRLRTRSQFQHFARTRRGVKSPAFVVPELLAQLEYLVGRVMDIGLLCYLPRSGSRNPSARSRTLRRASNRRLRFMAGARVPGRWTRHLYENRDSGVRV